MFVKLRGPVRVAHTFGQFEDTEVKTMEAKVSVSDAELIDAAFIRSAPKVLDALDIEGQSGNDVVSGTPVTALRNSEEWNITLSGTVLTRLYEAACEISEGEDTDSDYRQTPYTVLKQWADSSRYKEKDSDSPAMAMQVLSFAAMERGEPSILREPVDEGIDSLFPDYHDFLD